MANLLHEIEAASRLNLQVVVLDKPVDSPAKQIEATQKHIEGEFSDPAKIEQLASQVDVITIEIRAR